MKVRVIAASLAVALSLPAVSHATNGYFSQGFGVRSSGIAGIGIALPQDALAAGSNPAGTVLIGDRIDFGATWFAPERGAEIVGSPAPGANGSYDGSSTKNFFIPEFGYSKQISPTTGVGVAVYGNGGMNTDYNRNPYGAFIGSTAKAGINLEQLFITPSIAWKLDERNAIGAALNVAIQRFEAKGIANFGGFSANPANVSDQGKDTSTGVGLRLGWNGQVTPDVTLGLAWSSKINASKFSRYKGLFADSGGFDIPENYGAGITYKASPAVTLAAEVQQIKYGDIKSIANPIALIGPGNLGSANGAGFGWRDITVVKLGTSYVYSKDLTLRAGLSHSDNPVPASQTFFNILAPGVVQDHLTLGATRTLESGGELSAFYAHAFKKTVNGSGSLAGFGGGEANVHLEENILGVAYGWKL